jgi:adenylate cyclase class 2
MPSTHLETEIKLPVENVSGVRRRLRQLKFAQTQRRHLERNTIWDTPAHTLKRQGILLRLRTVGGRRGLITLKGPRKKQRGFKIRPEREIEVLSARAADGVLRALGYRPVFRYEKYRAEYFRKGGALAKGKALLDETPIGNYLELEGPKPWIRRMTRELGYATADAITETYGGLYRRWRRSHREAPKDMIFSK